MKITDIIRQLQFYLPSQTTQFQDTANIASLTAVGTTATAVTDAPHGLVNDQWVTISGALLKTPIAAYLADGETALITTASDHDQTLNKRANSNPTEVVLIEGATEPEFNGLFQMQSVPNRQNIVIETAATGSPTGAPVLVENRIDGYNGRFQITVIDPTTFTYELDNAPAGEAGGQPVANYNLRISGAITIEQAIDSYTRQQTDKLWAFVTVNPTTVSKSRAVANDLNAPLTRSDIKRTRLVRQFSVHVFAPTVSEVSAIKAVDEMENISLALFAVLFGWTPPNTYADSPWSVVVPNGFGVSFYNKAFMVHTFDFELAEDLTIGDAFNDQGTRALRNFEIEVYNENNQITLTANVDTDEQPLN